jgi:membrane fusion protein (multidrug efflux system)
VGTAGNEDGRLRPGMFATVYLEAPEARRSLWLPASAVAVSDMLQVLVVEDDAVAEVKVQTGRRDGDMLEIVSGLEAGQMVIGDVSGLHRGIPVTVLD